MVVLPALLFFAVTSGCEDSLHPALSALQQNNASGAISLLDSVRTRCTESSSFYDLLGVANELSGNSQAAEDALRHAVSLNPKSPRLLADLGATYLRNKKPKDAANALSQAVALDPTDRNAATYLIGAYVESGAWRRAADLFDRMGIANEATLLKQPIVAMWFAQTFLEMRQPDRIEKAFAPDREVMPPALLFSLGTLFAQHGLYAKAVEYLRQIPPEKADDAVYFNLGLACSHLQNFEEARRYYFLAIDKHPDHVEAYFRVGLDYSAEGEGRKAVPWLFRARDLAPNRPDISYALAEQLLQLKYFDSAGKVVDRAFETSSGNPLLTVASGDIEQQRGHSAAALNSYKKALAQQPKLIAALVGFAHVSISQGKDEEAQKYLREALSIEPDNPSANGELGSLEGKREDWAAALPHLSKAWAADRSDRAVGLQLARVLRHSGHSGEALQVLTSLQPVMGDSPELHLELAQLYGQLHRPAEAREQRAVVAKLEAQTQNSIRFEDPTTYVH